MSTKTMTATKSLQIPVLHKAYREGSLTPRELVSFLMRLAKKIEDNPIWIRCLSEEELEPYLNSLESKNIDDMPLYGIPFAIKDNIDLAGIETTAACPAFAYKAEDDAFVVAQLIEAGAIPMGKTNMDQFATGLVGARSPEPWGVCKNSLNSDYISGGSSSGSSLAVALNLVSFSLGTDTAGSGRVPASLNNIVGLKPSFGLLSTKGVVPACRSLDCVSIFTQTVEDANTIFNSAAKFDAMDVYARENLYSNSHRYGLNIQSTLKIGIPRVEDLEFFGNGEAQTLFAHAIDHIKKTSDHIHFVDIDFGPFSRAAKLLYEGPWVAERYLATKDIYENQAEELLPVIKDIIGTGKDSSAADAFSAEYRLKKYACQASIELDKVDAILTPTNGTIYTHDEIENDPINLNSNLGYYTNFMNLLDCAAVAVPVGFYSSGVGFGITVFHRAMSDKKMMSIAKHIQQIIPLSFGANPEDPELSVNDSFVSDRLPSASNTVDVVVCGAHLDGLALNWQLKERGGFLVEKTQSSKNYMLYALDGGPPYRPALVRHATHTAEYAEDKGRGYAIDLEVWRLPVDNFGSFVAEIPSPLGIGKVELADGRWLSGFICDSSGLGEAKDISAFGGWRHYLASLST